MTMLVTGGTGSVGRLVVEQLRLAGREVRVLSRRDGPGVVRGDLTEPASVDFSGVERMYLFPVASGAAGVVAAARAAGVRRIVTLSSATAGGSGDLGGHRVVEEAVEASGLEWTHVRPGEFAGNWLGWAESIRSEGIVRRPYGGAVTQPVHEADVAAVAAAALLEDGHQGRAYAFAGPEALTVAEQARLLGARFVEVDPVAARAEWVHLGYPSSFVDWMFGVWAASALDPAPVDAGLAAVVPTVTGRAGRTFARWAADHASDFS